MSGCQHRRSPRVTARARRSLTIPGAFTSENAGGSRGVSRGYIRALYGELVRKFARGLAAGPVR